MAREWHTFDHTADVGLAATADTLGELFEALGEALAAQICPLEQVRAAEVRPVRVEAEDVEALAVDFLGRILLAEQVDRFVVRSVKVDEATERSVSARLAGEPWDPGRHEFATEVKAVTYHQLKVAREGGVWVGRVILDL